MVDPTDKTGDLTVIGPHETAIAEFNQMLSPEGMESLRSILSTYSEYTGEDFSNSPGDRAEAYELTHEDFETLAQEFIKIINQRYLSKKGLLKEDPSNIIADILEKLGPKVYGTDQTKNTSEHVAALRLRAHMFSHLIYQLVLNESAYRKSVFQKRRSRSTKEAKLNQLQRFAVDRTKVKEFWKLYHELERDPEITLQRQGTGLHSALNSPQATHEDFFTYMDDPSALHPETSHSRRSDLTLFTTTFIAIKKQAEFFQKEGSRFNSPRQTPSALRAENDRVFELIKREATRGIPLCTCNNRTLLKGSSVVMQISPIDPSSGEIFEDSVAQINYHGKDDGEKVRKNRNLQEAFRSHQVGGVNVNFAAEGPTAYYLNRSNGEIRTMSVYPETLKKIAGERAYELLRRDILFYIAQLTCKPETLNKIFGDNFLLPTTPQGKIGSPQPSLTPGSPSEGESDGSQNEKPYKERRYPYGLPDDPAIKRATAIFTIINGGQAPVIYLTPEATIEADTPMTPEEIARAIENTRKMVEEGEIVSHKRLLPLIKRKAEDPEGVKIEILGAFEPSEKAVERARANGQILRKGIEFPHREEIFHPDQIPDLLKVFGCETVEELAEKYPNEAYIRYETWVDPEETRKEKLKKALEDGTDGGVVEIVRETADQATEAAEPDPSKPSSPRPIIARFKAAPSK